MREAEAAVSTSDIVALMRDAARSAGRLAMRWFREGEPTAARVWTKHGSSPVTEADLEVDAYLRGKLAAAGTDFGWLSEETVDSAERLSRRHAFVVDPIDGTRGFTEGDPRWCVSIALVEDGRPIAAVVHAPALGLTHEATEHGRALLNGVPIAVSSAKALAGARIAGPRFMLDGLAAAESGILPVAKIPSLAHRLCKVADASLDIGLASKQAHDWDIAAAHLIIERAGGRFTDFAGVTPSYNRETTVHGNLVAAPAASFDAVLAELGRVLGSQAKSGASGKPGCGSAAKAGVGLGSGLPNSPRAATERS